jgi:hypothetical protein
MVKPTAEVSAYLSSISGGKSKSPKKVKAALTNLRKAWAASRAKHKKEKKNGKVKNTERQDGV